MRPSGIRGHGRKGILLRRLLASPIPNVDCLIMEGSMIGRGEGLYPDEKSVEKAISYLCLLLLADLFDLGYSRIWISHPDWSPLTNEELQQLKDEVTRDLLHDYGEDELAFWFQASPDNSFLLMNVTEIWTEHSDDEEEEGD